jgi:hypothetical protein
LYLVGKRLIPTHNSEFSSYLFPAYFLGQFPEKKILMGTHTAGLSEDFGRRIRNLVEGEEYAKVFPKTQVANDQKAAGKWSTSLGGQYYAAGVGGALAGRGADLFVIDDPHALTLDTEVATTQGFKKVENIAVGDFVFSPDGSPVEVIGKSDVWQDREIYSVTATDGAVVYCDGGHLWSYKSDTDISAKFKNATARELADRGKKSSLVIPQHAAVQNAEKKLPIDPYVLGAWLGDGTGSLGCITAHLEEMYLTASIEQRTALLQGLMDTAGTVSALGQCAFDKSNIRLVQAAQQLAHSLGVVSTESKRGRGITVQKTDKRAAVQCLIKTVFF